MRNVLTIISLIILSHSSAQVVEVEVNYDGEISIMPSQSFLAEKQIKQVKYDYSTKQPNQIIKSSPDNKTTKYNNSGQLIESQSEFYISRNRIITHITHSYSNHTLVKTIKSDQIGYFATYFNYSGDTTFSSSYRAVHYNPNFQKNKAALDSTLISLSSSISTGESVRFFNKNGLHVRTSQTQYDSLGLVLSESLNYNLSKQNIKKEFMYNEEGLLSELKLTNQNGTKAFKYFYDHTNVLERMEEWKSGINTTAIEFVYGSNGWLEALIRQNPTNNHIKITKFTYKTF